MPSIQTAEVIPVEQDLSIAVEIVRDRVASWSEPITSAVLEHNPVPYMPRNVTPQEAMRIAEAYARCSGLRDRLVALLSELGIPVVRYTDGAGVVHPTVPRQAWAHRLILGHSGGISQAQARAAVLSHLDAVSGALLVGNDRLDAAGAYLWAALGPAPRRSRYRRRSEETPRPVLTIEQKKARRLTQTRESWRRCNGAAPAAVPHDPSSNGCCGRCGGPRKGHVRGLPCPPLPGQERQVAAAVARGSWLR
jgi:hypothetical protein